MEIPDLVRDRLEGEDVTAGVNLGDEDALCLTPSKTIVYTGEGLLSDESVSVYPHDAERLTVSEGRRKTKFEFSYVGGTRSFSVPANRTEPVLELVIGALLRTDGAADADESVEGVYRFSELTVIITDQRLVKHIGTAVWDQDYEVFPFADVTGLTFEQGSVATQIVLGVDGRPNRIKAPNDQAPMLRQDLENALYAFHDVESLEELNALLGSDEEEPEVDDQGAGFGLESDIDPLVGSDDEEEDTEPASGHIGTMETVDEGEGLRPSSMDVSPTDDEGAATDEGETGAADGASTATATAPDDSAASAATPDAAGADPPDGGQADADAGGGTPGADDDGTSSSASGGGTASAGDESTASAASDEGTAEGWDRPPGAGDEGSGPGRAAGAGASDPGGDTGGGIAGGAEAQLGAEEIEALETELTELRVAVESQNEELRRAVQSQNDELREAIEAQNEVLTKQHNAIKRLISELRSD